MNYLGSYHKLHRHATTVLFVVVEPNNGLVLLVIKGLSCLAHTQLDKHTHTQTHSVGLLWTSDRLIAETANYATHNKHKRQLSREMPNGEARVVIVIAIKKKRDNLMQLNIYLLWVPSARHVSGLHTHLQEQ